MPTFMLSMNFTDQGICNIKQAPKRAEAARDLGKKLGVEVKHLYLTSGESDMGVFVDTPSGDNVAKFVLALGSLGNDSRAPLAYGRRMSIRNSFLNCPERHCAAA